MRDLEQELRTAMRRVEAPEGFAERVAARAGRVPRRSALRSARPVWAAIAASAVVGLFGAGAWEYQRQQAAMEARNKLVWAMQVTSQSLQFASVKAFRGVKEEKP